MKLIESHLNNTLVWYDKPNSQSSKQRLMKRHNIVRFFYYIEKEVLHGWFSESAMPSNLQAFLSNKPSGFASKHFQEADDFVNVGVLLIVSQKVSSDAQKEDKLDSIKEKELQNWEVANFVRWYISHETLNKNNLPLFQIIKKHPQLKCLQLPRWVYSSSE